MSYKQPKISVSYLIFTVELTHGLACSDSIYTVLIFLLLVHTAMKDLHLGVDSESGYSFSGLDLDLESLL